MKIYSFASLFLLLPLVISAQLYLPLVEEGKSYVQWDTTCDVSGGEKLVMEGDTTIGEWLYKKVWSIQYGVEEPIFYGLVRTNSDNSKLWYLGESNNEYLVMDLTLGVGDSFSVPWYDAVPDITVESIQEMAGRSVLTFDRTIGGCLVGPNNGALQFIEGIGATFGFIANVADVRLLDCVANPDSLLYKNEEIWWTTCEVDCMSASTTNVEELSEGYLAEVYMVGHDLLIETFSNNDQFQLIDMQGKPLMSGRLQVGRNAIRLDRMASGMYVVIIQTTDQHIAFSQKIVVAK